MSVTQEMIEAALPGGVPPRIQAMIQHDVADGLLEDFKVGPILPFGTKDRPVRVAISDQGESAQWTEAVRRHWSGARPDDFLALAAPGVRRMIDTDGSAKAEIYLDDLQDHSALSAAELLRPPGDAGPAMCLTVTVPSGTRSLITRHETPPFLHLLGTLAESVADLVDQGAEGLWGLRWRMGAVVSVVWVTEARWRGTADVATDIALGLGAPDAWHRCIDVLNAHGRVGYPDAIELLADGSADVTLGVLPAD